MDLNFKAKNAGTHIITDDVLKLEVTQTQVQLEAMIQVLNKCHEIGLKLNQINEFQVDTSAVLCTSSNQGYSQT